MPAVSLCLNAGGMGRIDAESETLIPTIGGGFDGPVHALRADGFDASEDGTANAVLTPNGGRGGIGVGAIAFHENQRGEVTLNETAGSLGVGGGKPGQGYPAVAFQPRIGRNGRGYAEDVFPALNGADAGATSDMRPCVATAMQVRRLTPRECERLQGFPDDYTAIPYRGKPAADGPRYKALGNSMAVPVMRWIGERIAQVEAIREDGEVPR